MSWKKVKIKDILKQYRVQHIVQDDIEYKQVSILNNGSVVLRGSKIGKEIGRKRQFKVDLIQYPDTLIFTRQLLLQGSVGIASMDVHDCIVTENMPMFSIQTSLIDKEFLILFLKSEVFKSRIRQIELSGSAQKSIHEKTFLDLEFLIPNIELQKEIVVELLKLKSNGDGISSELTHQLDLVKQLRQSFLREAMQGKLVKSTNTKETGQQLLEKIKAEKAQLIAEKKLKKEKPLALITDDEIPFEIPEHWVWCRLGDISKHITDGEHVTPQKRTEGKMLLSAKNIRDGFITYENIDYISEEDFQKSIKRCRPQLNDILIVSVGGTIGRSTIMNDDVDFAIVRSVALIKPYDFKMSKYLKFVLDSPILQKEISGRSWGTAQPCLYINQIKELTFPLPPLYEQEQIVGKLEELMSFCDGLEKSIKESQGFNEMLLQQVLREALQPANN